MRENQRSKFKISFSEHGEKEGEDHSYVNLNPVKTLFAGIENSKVKIYKNRIRATTEWWDYW